MKMNNTKIIIMYDTFVKDFFIEIIIVRIDFNFLKTLVILITLKILKTLRKDHCRLTELNELSPGIAISIMVNPIITVSK